MPVAVAVRGAVVVEVPGAYGHFVDVRLDARRRLGVDRGDVHFAVDHLGEEVDAHRTHQWRGERIVDQATRILGRDGAAGRDHRRGRTHAGGQVPTVIVGAWHDGS